MEMLLHRSQRLSSSPSSSSSWAFDSATVRQCECIARMTTLASFARGAEGRASTEHDCNKPWSLLEPDSPLAAEPRRKFAESPASPWN